MKRGHEVVLICLVPLDQASANKGRRVHYHRKARAHCSKHQARHLPCRPQQKWPSTIPNLQNLFLTSSLAQDYQPHHRRFILTSKRLGPCTIESMWIIAERGSIDFEKLKLNFLTGYGTS